MDQQVQSTKYGNNQSSRGFTNEMSFKLGRGSSGLIHLEEPPNSQGSYNQGAPQEPHYRVNSKKSVEKLISELRVDQKRIERLSNHLYRSTRKNNISSRFQLSQQSGISNDLAAIFHSQQTSPGHYRAILCQTQDPRVIITQDQGVPS